MKPVVLFLLLIASLGLTACNSDSDPISPSDLNTNGSTEQVPPNGDGSTDTNGSTDGNNPVEPDYAEPAPTAQLPYPNDTTLGFYDYTRQGEKRPVRHDTVGSLPAMIQFAQNLTVDPTGNEAKHMPRLVTDRVALLLVTPDPDLGDISQLILHVTIDGKTKPPSLMRAPSNIFKADRTQQDERPDVVYSKRAWTAELPWNWVRAGLAITVTDEQGRSGTLSANAIDFAVPGLLVLNQIRLGMLSEPPALSNGMAMLKRPAAAVSDYFQTIPAAQMIVGKYEPAMLKTVMVSDGTIYHYPGHSSTEGSVYAGDMRSDVAKSTYSTGINLANWGITSAGMRSQSQPQLTQRAVVHHAQGKYTNGIARHGLSGGNGILTLMGTTGNEFSHEIGHHYGLGHYPGKNITEPETDFWNRHHADSGWGYIAYRNRFRANLNWNDQAYDDKPASYAFLGLYPYDRDAMSGGYGSSSLSDYTLYTGYSTQTKIQPAFDKYQYRCNPMTHEGQAIIKWNTTSRQMEVATPVMPNSFRGDVWYYPTGADYRIPRLCGVPGYTLLGGYIPETNTAVFYPPARTNWVNVFDLPAPKPNANSRQCWMKIEFQSKPAIKVALAPKALGSVANKFAVNVAAAAEPTAASLWCQQPGEAAVLLTDDTGQEARVSMNPDLPPMEPAMVVGKEAGYQALRAKELPQLEAALEALQDDAIPLLTRHEALLYNSWKSQVEALSAVAQEQLDRYQSMQSRIKRVNRWMFAYHDDLVANDPAAEKALIAFINKLQLMPQSGGLLADSSVMKVGGSNCLKAQYENGEITDIYISGPDGCTGATNQQWIVDANQHIHNGQDISQCLVSSNPVTAAKCDVYAPNQTWDLSHPPSIRKGNNCLDMANGFLTNGKADLILYSCTGGRNQQWTNIAQDATNKLLPLLHPLNLTLLQHLDARLDAVSAPNSP